ncbi:MAG: flagellar assembly protein FliH [Treponemataceae bacterium]|nr:flagellar assembly protein FliH [Treponemataceae bacterium]
MAKNVFRPAEIKKMDDKVMLKLTRNFAPPEEEIDEVDEPVYTGPTPEELQQEVDRKRSEIEAERQKILAQARSEADVIIKNAESTAFEEIKKKTDQTAVMKQQAEDEAAAIIKDAENRSLEIIQEAEQRREKTLGDAYKEGYDKGNEDGYKEGRQEANRLIDRLHVIIDKTLDRRQAILDETEQQIVELVLLISRKVVKVISENQRSVVMQNVLQALRRVKGRGDVTIRVNLADVELTAEHTKDFMQAVESVKNITVAEDSSVERGGCIIETDFGAIDARISSQLNELETKILEISPIKTVAKSST